MLEEIVFFFHLRDLSGMPEAISSDFRFPIEGPCRAFKLFPREQWVVNDCFWLKRRDEALKTLRAPCLKLWCIIKNSQGEMALFAWQDQKDINSTKGWREKYVSLWKYDKKCIRCAGIQQMANTTTTIINIRTTFLFDCSKTRAFDRVCCPGIFLCQSLFPIKV